MGDQYTTKSTSKHTATVADRVLSESTITRKVLRSELIDNAKNPDAAVKVTIVHQRKKKDDDWEDLPAESLAKLKAGENAKMSLSTDETLCLFEELQALSAIFKEKGILWGKKQLVVGFDAEVLKVPPQRKSIIQTLLNENHSEEIWRELVEKQPDLATKLSLARLQSKRAEALEEFQQSLVDRRGEPYWQDFFQRNTWIFGYGLKYQFLHTIQAQPHYGGMSVSGRGDERGDYLAASSGDVRFTVLVEIKKPGTELLRNDPYRNGVFAASSELAGAISQVQINCRKWEVEGASLEQNAEMLKGENVFTVRPKGILVVGTTDQVQELDRRNSFELLRRNTMNPEILTFDELYQRARYIVEHASSETVSQSPSNRSEPQPTPVFDNDDIPF